MAHVLVRRKDEQEDDYRKSYSREKVACGPWGAVNSPRPAHGEVAGGIAAGKSSSHLQPADS